MLHSKGNRLYFNFTTCGGGGAYGRVIAGWRCDIPKGLPQGPAVASRGSKHRPTALAWPRVAAVAGRGFKHRPAALAWPRAAVVAGRGFKHHPVALAWPRVRGRHRLLRFASSAPSIAYGARPPLGSASGLGGLALDRVFHSVEGCRATPRGCGLLLVHGRVYGQEVLGFRRLWARALVPGLNHFGLVLETVCAFYGVAR